MPRSLHELLQSLSDVMFPADEGRQVTIDSVGYDGDTPLHVMAWRTTMPATAPGVAPIATRNPISRVRARTRYDSTP